MKSYYKYFFSVGSASGWTQQGKENMLGEESHLLFRVVAVTD